MLLIYLSELKCNMSFIVKTACAQRGIHRFFCSQSSVLKNLVVCSTNLRQYRPLQTIKTHEEYEALKVNKSDLLVGWFTARWSTAGKMFEADFDKLATQFPDVCYLFIYNNRSIVVHLLQV